MKLEKDAACVKWQDVPNAIERAGDYHEWWNLMLKLQKPGLERKSPNYKKYQLFTTDSTSPLFLKQRNWLALPDAAASVMNETARWVSEEKTNRMRWPGFKFLPPHKSCQTHSVQSLFLSAAYRTRVSARITLGQVSEPCVLLSAPWRKWRKILC